MPDHKCCILADPKGGSWTFATTVYGLLRKRSDAFELNELSVREFANSEYLTKLKENVRRRDCFYIHDPNMKAGDWYTILCMVNHTLRTSSAETIIDVMPFMLFTRQDRKDESRVPVTPAIIADNVKIYSNRVMTLDVHNPAIGGFFNPVPFDNLHSFKTAIAYLKEYHPETLENVVVMSPDSGGASRARSFARRIGSKDIAIGYKYRDAPGEVNSLEILGEVSARNVILVDDMIDSGSTLAKAAEAIRKKGGERVYAYAAHGLFTRGLEHLVNTLDGLFVGDTLTQGTHPKLHVISFAALFAEAIYRTHVGESLSALFE